MQWRKFTLKTTSDAVDLVSGMLMEYGIDSFEIEDNRQITDEEKKEMFIDILPELDESDKNANIIFYMDIDTPEEEVAKKCEELENALEEYKMFADVGEGTITETTTKDEDWVNKWKEFFKPFEVDDILIKPTWEQVDNANKYKMVIEIDPGTAFGTGLHETTQLCIRALRKYLKDGMNLLDVGCGSGILSIIGKKIGAETVLGIDVDKAAVDASIDNAKVNGIESGVSFMEGNIIDDKSIQDKTGYECYDIVVANILADIIIPLSKVIAPHMKMGGLFITSGIINNKEDDVVKAIEENPCLEVKEITHQKDWVNVTAVRVK